MWQRVLPAADTYQLGIHNALTLAVDARPYGMRNVTSSNVSESTSRRSCASQVSPRRRVQVYGGR